MNRRNTTVLMSSLLLLAALLPAQETSLPQSKTTRQGQAQAAQAVRKSTPEAKPWKKIPIPPLPPFHPAQPKRVQLANGMVIFLQENHELPLITAMARIRGGSIMEPAAKVGLIDIYGQVWRTGGTKTRTGDQLDDYLEARAAKVETGGGEDSTAISMNCLKQDFDDVFNVFMDVLQNPEFRADKIELAKDQENTGIARRNDDVSEVAGREATFLAYGKTNPYARVPEYSTVAAITRDDLMNWHKRFVNASNIILGIAGDFDSNVMEAKLRKAFESMPKGEPAEETKIDFSPAKPGVYFAQKDDVNQSAIRMVALGIERNNPDYFAVTVMNEVFGGGFSSRLFRNIRTKQGLAYSVGGGVGSDFDHPGISEIAMGTQIANTNKAIASLNEQISELVKQPPTQDELKLAKDSILNSFVFNFDSPNKVLRERMAYEFYHYPADFLEQYRAGVEKVTVADVARVAKKYVHPGQFAVLVVGTQDTEKQLASVGPVARLDITIPTPGEKQEQAAPTSTSPEAKALMTKVIEGIGGESKVQDVKAMRDTAVNKVKTPQGEMEIKTEGTVVYPDRAHTLLNTPMGPMTMVYTPTTAFVVMSGQTQDLPASRRAEGLNAVKRDLINIAQHANDPKYAFTIAGTEKVGDVEATVLDINADGTSLKWFVDPQTGHVLRATYSSVGPTGPAQVVEDFADWKAIDGVTMPMQKTTTANGQQVSSETVETRQVNPTIDPKLFDKPAEKPAS
jgi:zinc protease